MHFMHLWTAEGMMWPRSSHAVQANLIAIPARLDYHLQAALDPRFSTTRIPVQLSGTSLRTAYHQHRDILRTMVALRYLYDFADNSNSNRSRQNGLCESLCRDDQDSRITHSTEHPNLLYHMWSLVLSESPETDDSTMKRELYRRCWHILDPVFFYRRSNTPRHLLLRCLVLMRQFEHDSFQAVCNQTTYGQYSSSVDSIKRNSTFSSEEDVEGSLYNGKEMRNGKIKAIWLIDNRGGANQVLMYLTDLATILGFKVLEAHDFGGKNDTVARNVNSINKSEVDILIATPGRLFSILDVLFKQRAIDRSILRNNTDEAHPTILKCW